MFCFVHVGRHALELPFFGDFVYSLSVDFQTAEGCIVDFEVCGCRVIEIVVVRWTKQEDAFTVQTGGVSSVLDMHVRRGGQLYLKMET